VRHGVEGQAGVGHLEILGRDLGPDVELRVTDDGPGMTADRARTVLVGGRADGGIGLSNVDGRMRAAFGEDYGLRIESAPGAGTAAVMTVPKFRAGVRAS
jgi:two-component system, LytTR family, sensor kinase